MDGWKDGLLDGWIVGFISIVEFHNLSLLMITHQNVSKQQKMGNKSLSLKLKVSKG